jgi:hypothetical protein
MKQSNLILNLLSEGLRPTKIATAYNIPIGMVTQEIIKAIDERRVLRSRVLTTLEKKWQDELVVWFPAWKKKPCTASVEFVHRMLKDSNLDDFDLDAEEVRLYLLCFEKGFKDGEIYEVLCEIERTLHAKIKTLLMAAHGAQETGWWRKGVPLNVRLECVRKCEEDGECVSNLPYNYTTLINLKTIIEQNTTLFQSRLPLDASGKNPNMNAVSKGLTKLNKIRNRVMHPVGAAPPSEEDFFFVKEMQVKFDLTKWR